MTTLLDAALRSSAPVLAALVACALLRHRSAALRHSVLTAGMVAAVAVMPLSMVLPSWSAPWPSWAVVSDAPVTGVTADAPALIAQVASVANGVANAVRNTVMNTVSKTAPDTGANTPANTTSRNETTPSLLQIVWLLWIAGVMVGGGVLLIGIVRLVRLTTSAETVVDGPWRRLAAEVAVRHGVKRPIVLLTTRASSVLATWGLLRPCVLLPAQAQTWDEDRARVVLCHELAHIRRGDWAVQTGADVLRTVLWFNPLIWILCARLRRESEHACDDAVLDTGVPAARYASHLIEIARLCRPPASGWLPAMSIARPSNLERRVTAMLNIRLNRQAPTWRVLAIVAAVLLGIVLPTASFTLSAQDAGPRALAGHVYDSSGSVLPAVEVALVNDRQVRWSTVTDGQGAFEFAPVGSGRYVLEATLAGFLTLHNDVTLQGARDWNRNITMQIGEIQETIMVSAKRPVVRQRASSADSGGPVRVGGNIKVPRKVRDARPVYPKTMSDLGLEGVVPMEALIAEDGTVSSVHVLSAQVHPEFARAAEEAVRQWAFTPTLLNGVPVEVRMTVSVKFGLED